MGLGFHGDILPVSVECLYPLRQAVLRPGQPIEAAVFPEDQLSGALHWAAVTQDGDIVGGVSLYPVPSPDHDSLDAWRLRGLAVLPDWRRLGIGRDLVKTGLINLDGAATLVWCYARLAAIPFYQSLGFESQGDLFDIKEIGLHSLMSYQL